MIRHCCCTGYIIIVAKLVILLVVSNTVAGLSSAQPETDTYFYNDISDAEIISNNTKILREGDEILAYLLYNKPANLIFLITDEDNTPVSLTVTPCASAVEWMVTYKSISTPEPSSNDYGDDENPFKDQLVPVTPEPEIGELVYSFNGTEAHTFTRTSNGRGFYTVTVKPTESDTYVKFFLKTKQLYHNFYPSLPRDDRIRSDRIRRKSFSFSWDASPDETPFDNIIKYCISISSKQSYDNYCSLMSHLQGDRIPLTGAFMFPLRPGVQQELSRSAHPVEPVNPKDIHRACVGDNKKYIHTQAKPGKTYYINVFAMNTKTKRSSSYKKIIVTTKKRKEKQIKKLRDGRIQELVFKKSLRRYDFKYVVRNTSDLFLAVHSCTGKVTLRIKRGLSRNQEVLKKKIKNTSMTRKRLEAGTYYISLVSRRKSIPRVVRFEVSKKQSKLRYPVLPPKSDVFLVENSTTYNSLTIGWRGTNSRQKYCVYQKEILPNVRRKRRRGYDHCSTVPIEGSQKVKCIRHKNIVLNHQLRNLKSNTMYQFDVVIQLKRGFSLLYKSLIAKTKFRP